MSDNPRQERIEAANKACKTAWMALASYPDEGGRGYVHTDDDIREIATHAATASDRVLWRLVRKWRNRPPTIGEKQLGVKPRSELYADELAALLLGEQEHEYPARQKSSIGVNKMGNWAIIITGTGQHHNGGAQEDADVIAKAAVDRLCAVGQKVEYASFTSGGRLEFPTELLGENGEK